MPSTFSAKKWLIPAALFAANSYAADAELPADYCQQNLFGEKVATNIELNKLVSSYFIESAADDDMQIRLSHNSDAESQRCAEQLKAWMVSLGFTSDQLPLEIDNARDGSFRFKLLD